MHLQGSNINFLFVSKQLAQMKKVHDELMASLKDEHQDEIAELDSKHSSAVDGKPVIVGNSLCNLVIGTPARLIH